MSDPADFAPPLLRIQDKPPAPLAGWMFGMLAALLACASAEMPERPSRPEPPPFPEI